MSVTVLSRVFWTEFRDLEYQQSKKVVKVGKPVAKLVMLAIADNADDFGENSWQSFETISKKASVERRSVIRIVKGLIEAGYLSINGQSRYGTNDYKITLGKLGHAPTARDRVGRPKTSDTDTTNLQKIGDSVTETSDPVTETSGSGSPESSFKHPVIKSKGHISEETKKAILANPAWAIAAGVEYVPDPEQVALQTIRTSWDTLMRTNTTWDRWENFDKWLLAQERAGKPAETFCKWFASDKFRRNSVGMWTPNGKAQGEFSFKAIYPQAFPAGSAATADPAPLDTPFTQALNTPYVARPRPVIQATR